MAKARSLAEFQQFFPDEAHCAAFLFERRWPDGFVCPGCGARRATALRSRAYTFECLDCGRQSSITAGTAMHRSKLPLTTWFWAAHLMATHSNGMSARQFQDQLGLTYKTAWLLTQKLRRSMVNPSREPLEGVVEVDQTEIPFRADDAFFDPDGSGKILIAGAVEVIDRDTNQAKPRRKHAKYLDTRSGPSLTLSRPGRMRGSAEQGFERDGGPKPELPRLSARRWLGTHDEGRTPGAAASGSRPKPHRCAAALRLGCWSGVFADADEVEKKAAA